MSDFEPRHVPRPHVGDTDSVDGSFGYPHNDGAVEPESRRRGSGRLPAADSRLRGLQAMPNDWDSSRQTNRMPGRSRRNSVASNATDSTASSDGPYRPLLARRFDGGSDYEEYRRVNSPSVSSMSSATSYASEYDLEAQPRGPSGIGHTEAVRDTHRPIANPTGPVGGAGPAAAYSPNPALNPALNPGTTGGGRGSNWLDRLGRFMPWAQRNAGTIFSIVGGMVQIGLELMMTVINIAKTAAGYAVDASRKH